MLILEDDSVKVAKHICIYFCRHSRKPWSKFINADNQHLVSPEVTFLWLFESYGICIVISYLRKIIKRIGEKRQREALRWLMSWLEPTWPRAMPIFKYPLVSFQPYFEIKAFTIVLSDIIFFFFHMNENFLSWKSGTFLKFLNITLRNVLWNIEYFSNIDFSFLIQAIDFLDKLLRYDHQDRLTAREAMVFEFLFITFPIKIAN